MKGSGIRREPKAQCAKAPGKTAQSRLRLVRGDGVAYLAFFERIQAERPEKRECMSGFLRRILKGKSALNRRAKLCPVLVMEEEEVLMGALLAKVDGLDQHLQISFFEAAKDHPEAFALLLEEARTMGISLGCTKITGGLNLHVNYGMGLLLDGMTDRVGFGMNYNPAFYNDLFAGAGFQREVLLTYHKDMSTFTLPFSDGMRRRLQERYEVRPGTFWPLKRTIRTYTSLNNRCFFAHPYYYPRVLEEDLELFRPFAWLLRGENLLFVHRNNIPVGFLLWYPDFAERIPKGKRPSLKTVLDVRLLRRPIRTFKIVEMGVLPDERRKGAILALFQGLNDIIGQRYARCESSWILDTNGPSKGFGLKWADGEGERYAVYEKPIR